MWSWFLKCKWDLNGSLSIKIKFCSPRTVSLVHKKKVGKHLLIKFEDSGFFSPGIMIMNQYWLIWTCCLCRASAQKKIITFDSYHIIAYVTGSKAQVNTFIGYIQKNSCVSSCVYANSVVYVTRQQGEKTELLAWGLSQNKPQKNKEILGTAEPDKEVQQHGEQVLSEAEADDILSYPEPEPALGTEPEDVKHSPGIGDHEKQHSPARH